MKIVVAFMVLISVAAASAQSQQVWENLSVKGSVQVPKVVKVPGPVKSTKKLQ